MKNNEATMSDYKPAALMTFENCSSDIHSQMLFDSPMKDSEMSQQHDEDMKMFF